MNNTQRGAVFPENKHHAEPLDEVPDTATNAAESSKGMTLSTCQPSLRQALPTEHTLSSHCGLSSMTSTSPSG